MRPLYFQLYEEFRDKIIKGEYLPGSKLPSKRNLSTDLNLSRTTIENAYHMLLDEGYIYSRARSGFYVSQIEQLSIVRTNEPKIVIEEKVEYKYEFRTAQIDIESFPFTVFRQLARKAFEDEQVDLFNSVNSQGYGPLRQNIAHYLFNSRGVKCTMDQVIIGSSTEQLIDLLTDILEEHRFLIEYPSYPPIKNVLQKKNIYYEEIPVIEDGIEVRRVEESKFDTIYVTPSHQFPTGEVMSIENRTRLIKWTNEKETRYIVEDDYDSEFRYFKKPLPALQSLDTEGKVVYISTFSKSLFSSARIAYMVLPKCLMKKYLNLKHKESTTVPIHMQYIVSEFLSTGQFDRHLNKMRKTYEKKISYIIERLKPYPDIMISDEKTGMHFLLTVKDGNLEEILARAEVASLYIEPLKTYAKENQKAQFVIGFGGIEEDQLENHMNVLINVLLAL